MFTDAQNLTQGLLVNKVPEVTFWFWVVKILSTSIGGAGFDYLALHVGLGTSIAGALVAVLVALALTVQIRSSRYSPWVYWPTVLLVSIAGTQISEAVTRGVGVSLYASTAAFALMLLALLHVWHRQEGTPSIKCINTWRREGFYWLAILMAFLLGTAVGDLAKETLRLDFGLGLFVFGAAVGMTTVAWAIGTNTVFTFWIAFVLTRPLGAALGDCLSRPKQYGGLGLGTSVTSVLYLIVVAVVLLAMSLRAARDELLLLDGQLVDSDWRPPA